mgnify:CR=1 FL=1
MAYTNATLIEAELRADAAFSGSTVPSLTQVTTWITETDAYIDHLSSNAYAQQTITDEYIDYRGESELILKHSPIISVSSLSYNTNTLGSDLGEGWVVKSEGTDFIVKKEAGTLILPFTTFSPGTGLRKFKCTYVSGYATTPATVQMLATKMVASRVLDSLLSSNVNEGNDGGSISVGSISIVEPGSYGVNTYKEMKSQIKELQADLVRNFSVYRYG